MMKFQRKKKKQKNPRQNVTKFTKSLILNQFFFFLYRSIRKNRYGRPDQKKKKK